MNSNTRDFEVWFLSAVMSVTCNRRNDYSSEHKGRSLGAFTLLGVHIDSNTYLCSQYTPWLPQVPKCKKPRAASVCKVQKPINNHSNRKWHIAPLYSGQAVNLSSFLFPPMLLSPAWVYFRHLLHRGWGALEGTTKLFSPLLPGRLPFYRHLPIQEA